MTNTRVRVRTREAANNRSKAREYKIKSEEAANNRSKAKEYKIKSEEAEKILNQYSKTLEMMLTSPKSFYIDEKNRGLLIENFNKALIDAYPDSPLLQ